MRNQTYQILTVSLQPTSKRPYGPQRTITMCLSIATTVPLTSHLRRRNDDTSLRAVPESERRADHR